VDYTADHIFHDLSIIKKTDMTPTQNENPPPKLHWQAENTHPELIEPLKKALREVTDPELGLDVVALGLIRDLKIQDQSAEIRMILTTPFCPYAAAMMEMTRQKAEVALGRPTTVEFGVEMWDMSMMEEGAASNWGLW
jgi:metal-sulfur cluster biosynthetic enzyme